jgi:dephospho-CoA kinase
MFIIGLTGGIGSGKTATSDYFASKNITIVDADVVSRLVVEPDQPALLKISEHFGENILDQNGGLNRSALRTIVFEKPEQRLWLEGLLHPLIAQEIQKQLNESQSPYTLLVSPILFESGQNLFTQRTLVVDAPENLQISRTTKRDHTDEKGVKAIMKAQTDREVRIEKADDILLNDGTLEQLHAKIDSLHEKYLTLAQKYSSAN